MKRTYELERLDSPDTNDERLAEIEAMPDEKVARVFACAEVRIVRCESCGEKTWLIGAAGWNMTDECHRCGEAYTVVG